MKICWSFSVDKFKSIEIGKISGAYGGYDAVLFIIDKSRVGAVCIGGNLLLCYY